MRGAGGSGCDRCDGTAVAAVDGAAADSTAEVQALDCGRCGAWCHLGYAAADGQGDALVVPSVDTYTAAGVTGVTDANLDAVNTAVAAVDGAAADSTAEVQALADGAIALGAISAYLDLCSRRWSG